MAFDLNQHAEEVARRLADLGPRLQYLSIALDGQSASIREATEAVKVAEETGSDVEDLGALRANRLKLLQQIVDAEMLLELAGPLANLFIDA